LRAEGGWRKTEDRGQKGFGKSRGQTRMASKTALNCWSYFFSDAASLFTSAFQLTYLDSAAKRVNYQKSIT